LRIDPDAVGNGSGAGGDIAVSLAFVSRSLVNMENGHLVFGDAVSRVADSLSPFGAAARIVAQSCALLVDMREINLEGRRIEGAKEVRLTELTDRRRTSAEGLRQMRSQLQNVRTSAQDIRQMLHVAQREIVKQHLRHEDRQLWVQVIQTCTQGLVDNTGNSWDGLVRGLDTFLNGSGATPAPPGQSANNQRRPVQQPRRRPRG
jgi:hypothetical protein